MLAAGASLPILSARAASISGDEFRDALKSVMAANGMPGAAAALLVDGKPVWSQSFGVVDAPGSRAVDAHTIFAVQSISKTFTATAVMLAVQRGLLNLDKPISAYLPDFTVNSRHEDSPQAKMTLRLLLSHRAGFTHEAPVGNNYVPESPSYAAHVRSIQDTWLRYPVGERLAYSNLGIDLAGRILEHVSGMPFGQCLKAWIFDPLGMADSTAETDVYAARDNRAAGHMFGVANVALRIPMLASGGVYSSIADMARYADFHLHEGRSANRQVLDPRLWRQMHDFRYGTTYALGIESSDLRFSSRTVRMMFHDGGGFGFGASLRYCPEAGLAWIFLCNGSTKPPAQVGSFDALLTDRVLAPRYGAPLPPLPPAEPQIAMAPEMLERWVGSYLNGDGYVDLTVQDGALGFRFRGDPRFNKLAFTAPGAAWVSDGPLRPQAIRFHEGAGLEAPHLELVGSGLHWDFNDGPAVPPGPVGNEYDASLGTYEIVEMGSPIARAALAKRNGYIYYNDTRAVPYKPGLLFGGSGEALDLRGATPTARNIPLKRVAG